MHPFLIFIIVVFLFYFLTKKEEKETTENKQFKYGYFDETVEGKEVSLIIAIMAKLAKSDGRICELEARLMSNTLTHLSNYFVDVNYSRSRLKQIFNYEKNSNTSVNDLAKEYLYVINGNYNKCLNLLEFLLNLSFIDGEYSSKEQFIVEEIVKACRINNSDYEKILSNFRSFYSKRQKNDGISIDDAYGVLGLPNNSSFDVVRKKYRQLVRQFHPDILTGQGKSQRIIEDATRKLQEINSAYEQIKLKHSKI